MKFPKLSQKSKECTSIDIGDEFALDPDVKKELDETFDDLSEIGEGTELDPEVKVELDETFDDLLEDDEGMEMDIQSFTDSIGGGQKGKGKLLKFGMIALVILGALTAALLALGFTVFGDKDNGPVPSPAPVASTTTPTALHTIKATTMLELSIMKILMTYTEEDVLLDASSPQGKAFDQLVSEATSIEDINAFKVLQRYALMTTYLSTGGDDWINRNGWNNWSEDVCDWAGIATCRLKDDGDYSVTNLDLHNMNLNGTIPSEICALGIEFEQLDLSQNNIIGKIPSCIVEYRKLTVLLLNDAKLSGEVVPGLLTLPNLRSVELYNNELSGSLDSMFELPEGLANQGVDPNIFSDDSLRTLRLDQNNFDGTVPLKLGEFTNLQTFRLDNNDFTGEMPPGACALIGNNLAELSADCSEIECDCCTACY